MEITVRIKNLKRLQQFFRSYPRLVTHAAAGAAFVEAEQIMRRSRPLVPVDTGVLRGSGTVLPPVVEGTFALVRMGYGGPAGAGGKDHKEDVGYARFVHDDPITFGITPGGGTRNQGPRAFRGTGRRRRRRRFRGQAFYLQQPFDDRKRGMAKRMARAMARRLGLTRGRRG